MTSTGVIERDTQVVWGSGIRVFPMVGIISLLGLYWVPLNWQTTM